LVLKLEVYIYYILWMAKPLLLFLIEFTCNKMLQGKDWYIGKEAKQKKNEKQEDGGRKSKRRVQIAVVV
jgi:hypothetical protein